MVPCRATGVLPVRQKCQGVVTEEPRAGRGAMGRRRLNLLVTAVVLAVGAAGCGGSSSGAARPGPTGTGPAAAPHGPAPTSSAELAAARGALMVLDDYERSGTAVKT